MIRLTREVLFNYNEVISASDVKGHERFSGVSMCSLHAHSADATVSKQVRHVRAMREVIAGIEERRSNPPTTWEADLGPH
ncbi:hypothetical protein EV294_102665 [Paenibacillus sp. BK033]|nr:hypothetical protein [Paenibacillus sp. BK720]TCM99369.1 hypothetical protein EV294_102665 [Paenibacillus sp. BK033]